MEDKIRTFLNNKKAIRFAAVMILFAIGLHFLFIALLEINLLEQVLSFGSATLNRLVSLAIGLGVLVVAFGAYRQDKEIVNTRLKKLKDKVAEEAREFRQDMAEKSEGAVEDGEVVEETKPAHAEPAKVQ